MERFYSTLNRLVVVHEYAVDVEKEGRVVAEIPWFHVGNVPQYRPKCTRLLPQDNQRVHQEEPDQNDQRARLKAEDL